MMGDLQGQITALEGQPGTQNSEAAVGADKTGPKYTLVSSVVNSFDHYPEAHADRCGHGRSGQTWQGNNMDTYADDLAAVIEALDLKEITMVGHSTGGVEVARYIGRHGSKRVKGAVLIASVGTYDCIKAFSETDFTEDLKKMDVPTLIIQGDADQIVPYEDAALLQAKLVRNPTLKIIPGAPHGLCTTHADEVNKLLLNFLQA